MRGNFFQQRALLLSCALSLCASLAYALADAALSNQLRSVPAPPAPAPLRCVACRPRALPRITATSVGFRTLALVFQPVTASWGRFRTHSRLISAAHRARLRIWDASCLLSALLFGGGSSSFGRRGTKAAPTGRNRLENQSKRTKAHRSRRKPGKTQDSNPFACSYRDEDRVRGLKVWERAT